MPNHLDAPLIQTPESILILSALRNWDFVGGGSGWGGWGWGVCKEGGTFIRFEWAALEVADPKHSSEIGRATFPAFWQGACARSCLFGPKSMEPNFRKPQQMLAAT